MGASRPVLLVTRPAPSGAVFAAQVAADAPPHRAVLSPLLEIVPLAQADAPEADAVVLTSASAVPAARRMVRPGAVAWCVGQGTAAAAREAGLEARACGGDAEALIAAILAARPSGRLLHPRGRHGAAEVAARLSDAGVPCAEVVVYDQVARPPSGAARAALAGAEPVVVPLFSPRTARIMVSHGPYDAPLHVVAISEAAAGAAAALMPRSLQLAARPDARAMVSGTRAALRMICPA